MRKSNAFKIEAIISTIFMLLNSYKPTLKVIPIPTYIFFMSPVYNVTLCDDFDYEINVRLNTHPYPLCSWLPPEPVNKKVEHFYISYNKLNLLRAISRSRDSECYITRLYYQIIDVKDDSFHRKILKGVKYEFEV